MKLKDRMYADALRAIGMIVEELGLAISRVSVERALYLCERHGSSPARMCNLSGSTMGRCLVEEDGLIEVDPHRCGPHLGPVIVHELTHRLCYCSPRFEDLNSPHMAIYDRSKFQEIVANGVEWLFYNLQMLSEICAGIGPTALDREGRR